MGRDVADNLKEVKDIIREVDLDGDGKLNEDEFVAILSGKNSHGQPLSLRVQELLMVD